MKKTEIKDVELTNQPEADRFFTIEKQKTVGMAAGIQKVMPKPHESNLMFVVFVME